MGALPPFVHAIAVDYDGTLAEGEQPDPAALTALAEARRDGVKVLIVTGRVLDGLLSVFPESLDHVDAVVAENGGVLLAGGHIQPLSPRSTRCSTRA